LAEYPLYPFKKSNDLQLRWSRRVSLTTRILAVNIFALALMVYGLFALDSFRAGLFDERLKTSQIKMAAISEIFNEIDETKRVNYLVKIGSKNDSRFRVYDQNGDKIIDNFIASEPTYTLRDPDQEPIEKIIARYLDYVFNFLVLAPELHSFKEPQNDVLKAWPNAKKVRYGTPYSEAMHADDLSPIIMTITKTKNDLTIIETVNAHDLRIKVRAERTRIFIFFLIVLTISILLSLFLARTIAKPLKHLAIAAVKVRLGRSPDVSIPRLPERKDEIGMLARALSDMSQALRRRIDRTQSFADDVAHEIKNPLASLRSALEGLQNVKDPKLSKQLMDIAKDDVRRMDRLINDIAEAGRVDSQISRAKFLPIDISKLIENIISTKTKPHQNLDVSFDFSYPNNTETIVMGEQIRIERVIENLIDNALSFAPKNTIISITMSSNNEILKLCISDTGPGIDENDFEKIFKRFYSERPSTEDFGKHSGLGLSISRTIIEAHHGVIFARKHKDNKQGGCFEIHLPLADKI